MYSLEA